MGDADCLPSGTRNYSARSLYFKLVVAVKVSLKVLSKRFSFSKFTNHRLNYLNHESFKPRNQIPHTLLFSLTFSTIKEKCDVKTNFPVLTDRISFASIHKVFEYRRRS